MVLLPMWCSKSFLLRQLTPYTIRTSLRKMNGDNSRTQAQKLLKKTMPSASQLGHYWNDSLDRTSSSSKNSTCAKSPGPEEVPTYPTYFTLTGLNIDYWYWHMTHEAAITYSSGYEAWKWYLLLKSLCIKLVPKYSQIGQIDALTNDIGLGSTSHPW